MAFGKYGDNPVDQARALRLVAAVIDDNTWEFQAVIAEAAADTRKESVVAVMVALAEGLANAWLMRADRDSVREVISFRLIEHEEAQNA